jgi:hypothetical protein
MRLSPGAACAALNALNQTLSGGTLVVYSGPLPAGPTAPLTSQNVALATFPFTGNGSGGSAFYLTSTLVCAQSPGGAFAQATASGQWAVAGALFDAVSVGPTAAGTATFARAFAANGTAVVADFSVGLASQQGQGAPVDLVLDTLAVDPSTELSVSGLFTSLWCG